MKRLANILGILAFAVLGFAMIIIVLYPHAMDYLLLTDKPVKPFGAKEVGLIGLGIVFCWGGYKFKSFADGIIIIFKNLGSKFTNTKTN